MSQKSAELSRCVITHQKFPNTVANTDHDVMAHWGPPRGGTETARFSQVGPAVLLKRRIATMSALPPAKWSTWRFSDRLRRWRRVSPWGHTGTHGHFYRPHVIKVAGS